MATSYCDICGFRPATARISLVRGSQAQVLSVCPVDLLRLQQQGPYISPLDALFAGEGFFGNFDSSDDSSDATPQPRHKEAVDISKFLSEPAKRTIQKAAEIASRFGRPEIDTEHLLYALTENEVVQEILRQFRVQPQEISDHIEATAPKGEEGQASEQFAISPRIKRVLAQALPISQELGHGYVGPEHFLISLAEEDEGMAGQLMRGLGLTKEALRQKTLKVVGKGAQEGRVESKSTTPQLDKYGRDLSKLAEAGKLDPVVGRSGEIETMIEVLSRRTKNNPVLIGEPGVGKTAIVEGLAQRIASGEIPETLQGKRVVELSVNALVAGSKYRGEFEERIKLVLEEVQAHQDELVLFIDELHTMIGAGSSGGEGGLDVSNIIKPSLARGELHLVGATTLNEYQKHIEKDAALERRFQPIMVPEPTVEQTIEILRGLRDKYEAHHKVRITDAAVVAAASLSDRYVTSRFLPDKAIDLIDQAAARVRIALGSHSPQMRELSDGISRLKREQESARSHKDAGCLKELEAEIASSEARLQKESDAWRRQKGVTSAEVTPEHIAQVVAKLTGVPVAELTEGERERLLQLEARLHDRVIGQEEAIVAVSDAVRRARSGMAERNRPLATFLFLGPTGVGKTELAKTLASVVYGDEAAMTRLDMSEYMEKHAVARLLGAPPGYVGHEEGGQLTEIIRRRPYSVLLLDEIEKAHPDIYNALLQVMDAGRLTDGRGRVADFSNVIIIATSNLGSEYGRAARIGFGKEGSEQGVDQQRSLEDVRQHFRPEFVNRLDEIIVFHALSREQIHEVVRLQLQRVARTAHGQGIVLHFDESAIDYLGQAGYSAEYGARELKRRIRSDVENPLSRQILAGSLHKGRTVTVVYEGDQVAFMEGDARQSQKPARKSAGQDTESDGGALSLGSIPMPNGR